MSAAGPRLAKLEPGALSAEQRELYASITGGPRARGPRAFALTDEQGRLEGPFNAMLLSPATGTALQELGSAVRYRTAFSDREREIAILVVARHWDSGFERYAHEAVGRVAGLTEQELAALRAAEYDIFEAESERCVAESAHALAAAGDLDDAAHGRCRRLFGDEGLFELTTLVGYYATLALQLRVFRVQTPA